MMPMVHANGTSRESLVEQRMNVVRRLRETLSALGQMAPHGRDYYLLPDHHISLAKHRHALRGEMLGKMMQEIEDEAITLQEHQEGAT